MDEAATPDNPEPIPISTIKLLHGTELAVGAISARALSEHFEVPRRNHSKKTGYQRELTKARVNRLVRDLRERRVDIPTSILLNLREFDRASHIVSEGDHRYLALKPGDRLYVVDGQHRAEALSQLVEDDPERWAAFAIPVVCMLGADLQEEIKQFYVVNSTAKSVRTDLALDLLKQRAESEPGLRDALIESGEVWKVKGQQLTERLAATPAWKSLIRFSGEPAAETTIRSSGMVSSLKQVLATPFFSQLAEHQQLAILDAYWRGIKTTIPDAFENPTDYVLQKTTGVMVMHGLLVSVIEHVRSAGRSLAEPQPYADALMDALSDLEGDTTRGDIARGADFWRGRGEGAAASYSSNAGRRVLLAKLRSALPEIELE